MHFAAFFNEKARKWVNVRKDWFRDLKDKVPKQKPYCWIHCASAGEFEQAIPVIEAIRKMRPDLAIAVSFFSPSGYEHYYQSGLADVFFYFPLDTRTNAKKMLNILQPFFAIFIRNEVWWNILSTLKEKNIPSYLVNSNLKQERNYFYQRYLDNAYKFFTKIFDASTYNTKLERVCENREYKFEDDTLTHFCANSFVIILGSSWQEEERMMGEFFRKNELQYLHLKVIIAPHEYDKDRKRTLEKIFGQKIFRYSKYEGERNPRILFLDKKGILKYAYRFADLAFIGGGLEKTVHNVSEAAVYGIPTIFGTNYLKFEETVDLVNIHTAFPIRNYSEFEEKIKLLLDNSELRTVIKEKLENYFDEQNNSSEKIVSEILK